MELIDKTALVAEIENLENTYKKCPTRNSYEEGLKEGRLIGYEDALYKIGNLKVEEVNLEKEIESSIDNLCQLGCYAQALLDNPDAYEGFAKPFPKEVNDELSDFARHFFEFGLKAKKGE